MVDLPHRGKQICGPRRDDEGLYDYKRRVWEAEFSEALDNIEDVNVKNALFALKMLRKL